MHINNNYDNEMSTFSLIAKFNNCYFKFNEIILLFYIFVSLEIEYYIFENKYIPSKNKLKKFK